MTWTYIITNKNFLRDGVYQFSARYTGAPGYKDQARYQCLKNKGPLPSGTYRIGSPYLSSGTGPSTLPLLPEPDNNMCGREAFLIHGDSLTSPGSASKGCIVIARSYRERIWQSGDRWLVVK